MEEMKDLMLDIETLGTSNDALITTVSTVQFDLESGKVGSKFEMALDWREQEKIGAKIDADTVLWWMKQEDDAIKSMANMERRSIQYFMSSFRGFILDSFDVNINDIKMWGNGVSFDNLILRNLFKRHNQDFPLPFWCDVDVRTLVAISPRDVKKETPFVGIKHNGIDDCLHQIKYCNLAYKTMSSLG